MALLGDEGRAESTAAAPDVDVDVDADAGDGTAPAGGGGRSRSAARVPGTDMIKMVATATLRTLEIFGLICLIMGSNRDDLRMLSVRLTVRSDGDLSFLSP
jgi:hypothetical protein